MDYEFFKWLAANLNQYACKNLDNRGFFGGSKWENGSTQEWIQFHGVILKMSLDDCKLGGYKAYFNPPKVIQQIMP